MGDCNAGRQERSSGRMVLEREWSVLEREWSVLAARRCGQRRNCVWILRGKAKSAGGGLYAADAQSDVSGAGLRSCEPLRVWRQAAVCAM